MRIPKEELKVLKKFVKGKVVESKVEEIVLEEYRKIGWIHFGIRSEKKGNTVRITPTASLTPLGKQFVQREAILRSPWKKFFYKLINIPI